MESHIKANAELVRTIAREKMSLSINYDEDGVRWLDGYIDRQRDSADDDTKRGLVNTLGSYLGECVRQTYGGEWIQNPELGWGVRINEKLTAFPFNKVQKQLANADGDSVLGFFTAIAPLLNGNPAASPPPRPWWKFW